VGKNFYIYLKMNMKNTIVFLGCLLAIWIVGSAYVYVCKVRMDCGMQSMEVRDAGMTGMNVAVADSLAAAQAPALALPGKLTVYFDHGRSECELDQDDFKQMGLFKEYLGSATGHNILVTGYADNTGSAAINEKISNQRAEFMKRNLVDMGIPVALITVSGKGELEPVSDNNTDEGRALNRRTELLIH